MEAKDMVIINMYNVRYAHGAPPSTDDDKLYCMDDTPKRHAET